MSPGCAPTPSRLRVFASPGGEGRRVRMPARPTRLALAGVVLCGAACTPHPVGPARTYDGVRGQGGDDGRVGALGGRDGAPRRRRRRARRCVRAVPRRCSSSDQEEALERGAGHLRARSSRRRPRATTSGPSSTSSSAPRSTTSPTVRVAARRGQLDELDDGRRPARRTTPPPCATSSRRHAVKKVLAVILGILTAIGGFVDMGDLVANAETGARFRHEPGVGRARRRARHHRLRRDGRAGRRDLAAGRCSTSCASGSGRGFGARQPRRVVLHQLPHAHRRDRRRRHRPLAGRRASTTCS